jgi:hypothetical protein
MRDQLAEISRTHPAIHSRAKSHLHEFKCSRLVRRANDVNEGQNIRCAVRNFVKRNSAKPWQAGFSRSRRQRKDFRQLIVHPEAKIQLVIRDNRCRLFSPDNIKPHTVHDHTTTARQTPAFWKSGRSVTSHSAPALIVYLRAPSSERVISLSMILTIVSATSVLT